MSAAELAKRQARARASRLVNVTSGLSGAIGKRLVAGEAAVQVQSAGLSMGISKADPCDTSDGESSNQTAPALSNGVSGSFSLPAGSQCNRNTSSSDHAAATSGGGGGARRRRLQAATSSCEDGSSDDSLEVGLSPEHTRALANEEAQAYLQDVQSLRATLLEARRRLLLAAAVPGRNRRLRVAYLSGTGFQSFTTTAHFIVGVLEAHRPETVDASCYAFLPDDGSEIRRRIGRACGMHEAAAWSHAEVAARLNDAMVHVLVDSRILIFKNYQLLIQSLFILTIKF